MYSRLTEGRLFLPSLPVHIEALWGFFGGRPLAAQGVALDALIQVLIWAKLRAVGREEGQPDLRGACGQPSPHGRCSVHRVPTHDGEERGSAVPQHELERPEEYQNAEPLLEHHERELASIRDSGERVAAEPLPRAGDH
jgi:hypothetical protein